MNLEINQTLNEIKLDDVKSWLLDHGIDLTKDMIKHLSIDFPNGPTTMAWIEVEFYKRSINGRLIADLSTSEAVTGHVSIPLKSWPVLTAQQDESDNQSPQQ